jgi:signal transduction histidine kinase
MNVVKTNDPGATTAPTTAGGLGFSLLGQFAHDLFTPLFSCGVLTDAIASELSDLVALGKVDGNSRISKLLKSLPLHYDILRQLATEAQFVSKLSVSTISDLGVELKSVATKVSVGRLMQDIGFGYAEAHGLNFIGDTYTTSTHVISVRVEIECDFELTVPESWMRRALTNIVRNAHNAIISAKTVGPHSIEIDIDVTDGFGLICVTDTGTGMSDEVRSRMFERGFTVSNVAGSGIGLGVVQDFFEGMLGGKIEVDSAPGGGTQFLLKIPLAEI